MDFLILAYFRASCKLVATPSIFFSFSEGATCKKDCKHCQCSELGSVNPKCDNITGQCSCKSNIHFRQCDDCVPGYDKFPNCTLIKEGTL